MRIGILAHCAHPIGEPYAGGLEMIVSLLVDEFVKRNHEVHLLCKEGSTTRAVQHFYDNSMEFDGNAKSKASDIIEFGYFYKDVLNFCENGFDLINNHCLSHHAIIVGQLLKVPFVTTIHTPILRNFEIAEQSLSGCCNQTFVAVSKHIAQSYAKYIPSVKTIYNGIDLSKWELVREKEDYFIWCGRVCKEKGLKEIMDLSVSNGIHLKIAGPISDREYFETEITPRLSTYNKCDYLGHLNQAGLNQIIGHAKALIFSSTWQEPYGLVIAEALACGTPIVANNIGAASEILTESSGVLFELGNPDSFTKAIDSIKFVEPDHCRLRAETFCSHKVMVNAYEALFNSVRIKKQQLIW